MSSAIARSELLIHVPPKDVFDAFVEPRTIEKFWLKKTSGPLAEDSIVEWDFMVKGAHETVNVSDIVANQSISFTWSSGISVKMQFQPQGENSTKATVSATGFKGTDVTEQAIDTTEGFTIVLCDLKSLLETGKSGNMVRDKAALISSSKADA